MTGIIKDAEGTDQGRVGHGGSVNYGDDGRRTRRGATVSACVAADPASEGAGLSVGAADLDDETMGVNAAGLSWKRSRKRRRSPAGELDTGTAGRLAAAAGSTRPALDEAIAAADLTRVPALTSVHLQLALFERKAETAAAVAE